MLHGQKLGEFVERHGGGDDQLFLGARQTPRMEASIEIDSGRGLNEYCFALVHVPARDCLMFVQKSFRYSQHGRVGPRKTGLSSRITAPRHNIVEIAQGAGAPRGRRTACTLVHLLKRCGTYQFHDTSDQAPIKTAWDQTDCAVLRSHGGNLAAVLLYLREEHYQRYRLIEWQVARVLTNFRGFELEPAAGRVQLRWRSNREGKSFGAWWCLTCSDELSGEPFSSSMGSSHDHYILSTTQKIKDIVSETIPEE